MGWSRSPVVETAAHVSVYVFVSMLLSPVCQCHVYPGPSSSCTHVQSAVCKLVLFHRASVWCLPRRLLGGPLAILIHVTSDPELACPCLGLISSQSPVCRDVWLHEQDFLCPWWQLCVFACVPSLAWVSVSIPARVSRACLEVGGVRVGEGSECV